MKPLAIMLALSLTVAAPAAEGMPSMKLKQGGRATGLAGAACAAPLGVDGAWVNPAAAVGGKRLQLSLAHQAILGDASLDSLALLGRGSWRHNFAFFGSFLTAADTARTVDGKDTGEISNNARVLGLLWDINWDVVSMGFAVKQYSQAVADSAMVGYAGDMGLQVVTVDKHLRFGAALQNVGFVAGGPYQGISNPLVMRAGFVLDGLPFEGLLAGAELRGDPNTSDSILAGGAEYALRAAGLALALRGGYESVKDNAGGTAGLSLGGGVGWGDWVLDLAWMPQGPLGNPLHVSLAWSFGDPAEVEEKAYWATVDAKRRRRLERRIVREERTESPVVADPIVDDKKAPPPPGTRQEAVAYWADQACVEGEAALKLDDFEKAKKAFEEATRYSPELLRAWRGLGNAYYRAGNLKGAVAAFSRASSLSPDDVALEELVKSLKAQTKGR